MAGKKLTPVYMDLAYVPHHGNSYYSHVEFFKKIRARYYVFSGTEPSKEVYNALLEAKQTWEDKSLGEFWEFDSFMLLGKEKRCETLKFLEIVCEEFSCCGRNEK